MQSELDPKDAFAHYNYFGHLRFNDLGRRVSLDGYDFHCGDCLDVLIEKDWVKARIEHCTEFYLLLFPFAKPAQAINLDEMLGLIARAGS